MHVYRVLKHKLTAIISRIAARILRTDKKDKARVITAAIAANKQE